MTPEQKSWIDNATYYQLLELNRFAPIGSLWFQGEVGDYFLKVMAEKKAKLSPEEQVQTSKDIGWERR